MLVLTRRPGEALLIEPEGEASGESLFAEGPIEIYIKGVQGNQVKLAIQAPLNFKILRAELEKQDRARLARPPEA